MAQENKPGLLSSAASGFNRLPVVRQLGLLIGLSASIALGFSVVLWIQEPSYRPLYSQLDPQDTAKILDVLQQSGIKYKFNQRDGTVLVAADAVHQAKLKLAASGLPKASNVGFNSLDQNSGLGTSRFMENARYIRALEGELSRTISNIKGITSARVHLAIPQYSVFVKDDRRPSASVFIDLASGLKPEQEQVSAIVQMVASSITGLNPSKVTVTDQYGRLLTSKTHDNMAISKEQFNYKNNLQTYYEKRIESMISPLLGPNKVRVRISANLDFTQLEQANEKYNPNEKTIRSEQTVNESLAGASASGAAGALANQAPNQSKDAKSNSGQGTSRSHSTKNYEVGKTVSYQKLPVGVLKNLSVAVVVDDESTIDAKTGKVTRAPLTKQKLEKITSLVKTAIGFDSKRGDRVSVINSAFVLPPAIKALPPLSFWQQSWFWDLVKKGAGVLVGLLLAFGLLRPLLRNLANKAQLPAPGVAAGDGAQALEGSATVNLTPEMIAMKQQQLDSLKTISEKEPTRVASVLKDWVEKQK